MKLDFNPYCRSCQTSHAPGQHIAKGRGLSPAKDASAAAPARAKSATKTKKAPSSTPAKPGTATRTNANGAAAGTSAGGRSIFNVKTTAKTLVQEVRRAAYSKVDPLAALKVMSRIELEALASHYVIERAKRQKAKAKTQAKWRKKVREVIHG